MPQQARPYFVSCLLLVLVTNSAFAQSTVKDASPTLKTYGLADELDGKTTKAVLETLLSGRQSVRVSLDLSLKRIVALGNEADHRTIVDTIDVLQNPIRIDADTFVSQPTRSGQFLRVYALDDSVSSIAKTIVESILADHEGVRLSVDPKNRNLIVFAAGPEHQLIAESLGELLRSNSDDHRGSETIDTSRNGFVIHSFLNQLLLLNSKTGDTWILEKTDVSQTPTWTRVNRDK